MTNKIEDYVDLVVEAAGYEELVDYARAYLRQQAMEMDPEALDEELSYMRDDTYDNRPVASDLYGAG